ncbi:MAG: hypothetical protein VKK42_19565 [Lyngbya sp.]|nr:hypothetical protein [Lyngbya sp.]
MSKEGRWRDSLYTKMAQEEAVTYLPGGKQTTTPPHEQPNYDVFAITLQEKKDKDRPLIITGNEITIPTQISLLKAVDMWAEHRGINLTFEDFWKYWEEGFSFAINRAGTPGLITNYPINDRPNKDGITTPGFRKDRDERPGYLEFKNPNIKNNPLFKTIEYWPNRSLNESYLLIGSDRDIINQIIQLEHRGTTGEGEGEAFRISNDSYRRIGHPEIFIKFYQRSNIEPGKQPLKSVFQICMNEHVEKPSLKVLPQEKILDTAELKNWKNNITAQFFPTNVPYILKRGRESYAYNLYKAGFKAWSYFRTQADARALFEKLSFIRGLPFNEYFFTEGSKPVNETPYLNPSAGEMVLGEPFEKARYRPIADLEFWKAWVYLPNTRQKITLVSRSNKDPVDSRVA